MEVSILRIRLGASPEGRAANLSAVSIQKREIVPW